MADAPKLDPRSLPEIVAQTEALAAAYTASSPRGPWRPAGGGGDLGGTLVRLFGTMVDHLVRQLNRVPDKHRLAFTGLLGARRVPSQPARAAVTFHLAPGDGTSTVPADSQVAAESGAVFETELELPLTRAELAAAFVSERGRYADRSDVALGKPGRFDAFAAKKPIHPQDDPDSHEVEHELDVAVDRLLALPGAKTLTVAADPGGGTPLALTWYDPAGNPLGKANAQGVFSTSDLGRLVAGSVGGRPGRWLVGKIDPPGSAYPKVTVSASMQADPAGGAPPDAAFFNSIPLAFTRDVLPFGERPRLGDTFYLASDAAFGTPGASVTLRFALTVAGRASNNPVLAWEIWDGRRATSLAVNDGSKNLTAAGDVTFTLADAVPVATVNGVPGRWIRARLVGGNYGVDIGVDNSNPPKLTAATFQAPAISALSLACSAAAQAADLVVVRRTALSYETMPARQPIVAYLDAPTSDPVPALYLAFDRPFEPQLTTLYLQAFPPPSPSPAAYGDEPSLLAPVRVIWEYSSGVGWRELAIEDTTADLSHSGLIRFSPPDDMGPLERFGRVTRWLRARPRDPGFSPMPALGRVATNTVWAANAHTTRLEVLGGSNAARSQTFRLSQAPVLDGQRIEVGEPEQPAAAELERSRREEGDALTVDADPRRPPIYWLRWHAVADFWASGPRDRHYTFDAAGGTVTFGDGVNGMIPPRGAQNIRAAWYRAGGGAAGDVPAGAISQLKSTVAGVDRVSNGERASGGADIEAEGAMVERSSRTLRHGYRAVTAQDFADLALEASKAVARAVTLTPSFSPIDQAGGPLTGPKDLHRDGEVIVVIVPTAAEPGQSPPIDLLAQVSDYLRARCSPGVKLLVIGPSWVRATIDVRVAAKSIEQTDAAVARVREAIVRLLDPVSGGSGDGWDFGRRPRVSDLVACISAVPAVDHVSHLAIACEPPFDIDDATQEISIDALSLYQRLLVYAGEVKVAPSGGGP